MALPPFASAEEWEQPSSWRDKKESFKSPCSNVGGFLQNREGLDGCIAVIGGDCAVAKGAVSGSDRWGSN